MHQDRQECQIEPLEGYNQRYLIYCAAQGFKDDPQGMLALDRKRWPGGHNAGYIIWIQRKILEFMKAKPQWVANGMIIHGADFDAWVGQEELQCQ